MCTTQIAQALTRSRRCNRGPNHSATAVTVNCNSSKTSQRNRLTRVHESAKVDKKSGSFDSEYPNLIHTKKHRRIENSISSCSFNHVGCWCLSSENRLVVLVVHRIRNHQKWIECESNSQTLLPPVDHVPVVAP